MGAFTAYDAPWASLHIPGTGGVLCTALRETMACGDAGPCIVGILDTRRGMFRGAVGIRTCGRSPCTLWEAPNTPEGRKQVFVNLEAAFVEFFFSPKTYYGRGLSSG